MTEADIPQLKAMIEARLKLAVALDDFTQDKISPKMFATLLRGIAWEIDEFENKALEQHN